MRHSKIRFPPPWTVEELDACFVATDSAGQKLCGEFPINSGALLSFFHSRARGWAAFSSFNTYRKKGRTFSISVRLAISGKSFTAGCGIGWKIRLT